MCIRDRFYSLNRFWRQVKCLNLLPGLFAQPTPQPNSRQQGLTCFVNGSFVKALRLYLAHGHLICIDLLVCPVFQCGVKSLVRWLYQDTLMSCILTYVLIPSYTKLQIISSIAVSL